MSTTTKANRINIEIRNSTDQFIIDIDEPRDGSRNLQDVLAVAIRRVDFINARETEMENFYIRSIELEGEWINQ